MVSQDIEHFVLNDNKNNVSAKTKEQVANGGNIREVTWKDAAKAVDRMLRIFTTLFTSCLIVGFIVINIIIRTKANKNIE
jgi:nucleoside recognition membrane protein YjiH